MSRYEHGYLLVDHSASPGLPEDVARASGYDPALTREGKKFEAKTLTCKHCRCSVVPNPLRTRERGFCYKCMHYVCDICAYRMTLPDYVHAPFEAQLDGRRPFEALGTPPESLILP